MMLREISRVSRRTRRSSKRHTSAGAVLMNCDALFPEGFFFALRGGPPDVSPLFLSLMNPQGDFRELVAHVIEVLMDIFLKFPEDLQRRRSALPVFTAAERLSRPRIATEEGTTSASVLSHTGQAMRRSAFCFSKALPVLEPSLEFMAVPAFQIVNDHDFPPELCFYWLLAYHDTRISKKQPGFPDHPLRRGKILLPIS